MSSSFITTIRDSILILLFEMLGTMLLAMVYNTALMFHDVCGFMMCFYSLLVLGAKISGSHYNPAITLAFMLRSDTGKFSRVLGIAYWIFQFGGAILGALLAWFFTYSILDVSISDPKYIPAAIVTETLGTVLLAFLYLTQTEESTKLSKDPAISTLIIAACYTGAIYMVSPPNVATVATLNPALGLAIPLVNTFNGNGASFKWFWIYTAIPFVGALVAVIFHEFVYKKIQENIDEVEHQDNEGGMLDRNQVNTYDDD